MSQPNKNGLRDLCAQTYDDDIDPRLVRRAKSEDIKISRKDRQLSSQVRQVFEQVAHRRALRSALALMVIDVSPEPGGGCLRVVLAPSKPHGSSDLPRIHDAARGLMPEIRTELSRVLARKRLPRLILEVLPSTPLQEHNDA